MLRRFAEKRAIGLTEAVKLAVSKAEAADAAEREQMLAVIKEFQDRFASYGKTGLRRTRPSTTP